MFQLNWLTNLFYDNNTTSATSITKSVVVHTTATLVPYPYGLAVLAYEWRRVLYWTFRILNWF